MMVNSDLLIKINLIEKDYRDLLESFFLANYPVNHLISHGLDHHRRVWNFAKELINCAKPGADVFFIRKLMIACFLHDIGMSLDPGIRHGLKSRKLCEKFLEQNNILKTGYQDTLEAIEYHDDKKYTDSGSQNSLLNFLSVADDLDAFGITGIYRYAEIYLVRGIPYANLGNMVLENVAGRFRNFCSHFGKFVELTGNHRKRYELIDEFYSKYNNEVESYNFGSNFPSGNCGIIEIINVNLQSGKYHGNFFRECLNSCTDKISGSFFSALIEESL